MEWRSDTLLGTASRWVVMFSLPLGSKCVSFLVGDGFRFQLITSVVLKIQGRGSEDDNDSHSTHTR